MCVCFKADLFLCYKTHLASNQLDTKTPRGTRNNIYTSQSLILPLLYDELLVFFLFVSLIEASSKGLNVEIRHMTCLDTPYMFAVNRLTFLRSEVKTTCRSANVWHGKRLARDEEMSPTTGIKNTRFSGLFMDILAYSEGFQRRNNTSDRKYVFIWIATILPVIILSVRVKCVKLWKWVQERCRN